MAVTRSRHGEQKSIEQTKLLIKRKARGSDDKRASVKRHKAQAPTDTPKPQRQPSGKRTIERKPVKTSGTVKAEKAAPTPVNCGPEVHEVVVNRAPVLTLWVAEVAKRQGYDEDAALTFGKAVSGMFAQAKGKSIGVFESKEKDPEERQRRKEAEEATGVERVDVFGRHIKAKRVDSSYRAMEGPAKVVNPAQVRGYLQRAFKDKLCAVQSAMQQLANAYPPDELAKRGYDLYVEFRPSVPGGARGWGAKATLSLDRIQQMASGP